MRMGLSLSERESPADVTWNWSIVAATLIVVVSLAGIVYAAPEKGAVGNDQNVEPAPADSKQIAALIRQLGSDDFFVRDRAQVALTEIGIEAFDALSEAENDPDVEIAERARYLLRLVRVQWVRSSDPAEVKKLLDRYATGNDEEREGVINDLAAQPIAISVPVLGRIVRFEKSNLLSRLAALAIMDQAVDDPAQRETRLKAIESAVAASPRPTADWLRVYVASQSRPAEAIAGWNKVLDQEVATLQQFPNHTRSNVLFRLIKQQVALLEQLQQNPAAVASMQRLLAIEPESNDDLADTVTWLVEQKAWPVIDSAAEKYADRVGQDPLLLYLFAEAYEAQGNSKLASERIEQARKLNAGDQIQHLVVAIKLQRKGKIKWSADEYRVAIKLGQPGQLNTLRAQSFLSEMLHDQGDDEPAAEVLQEALTTTEAAINGGKQVDDLASDLKQTRARMHYFFACVAEKKGELPKQYEQLQRAIQSDDTDADVLIGLHRYPSLTTAQKADVKKKIQHAADKFRLQIQENADDATAYNQLAWLIGNTEGDYQEALNCSRRSLVLKPKTAGYLDTLGRCYFAVGDLENAIKSQLQAVELDPHSGLMKRQLEFFKKTKESRKG